MPAHVPQAAIDLQISTCTVTHGTWYDWHSWAVELSDWKCSLRNIKKHTTWVITKDSKVTTYWKRSLCFWFARSVSLLTRFKSVRRTWHFFHKQCAKWLFYFCHQWCVFLAYSCINLQFNFQQTQLHWNIYKHIFIVSCSLATMPAWQFVFLLSTTLKRIRKSGQRNAQVFVTVFKAVSL